MSVFQDSDFATAILHSTADGIVVIDADGMVLDCNPAACELLGRPRRELVGEQFGRPIVTEGELAGDCEIKIVRSDGCARTVELRTAEAEWDQERVTVIGLRDITERRDAEKKLRLLGEALEAAANAIAIVDRAGRIEWVNPAFSELTGYAAREARGSTLGELQRSGHHDDAFYQDLWKTILNGEVWRGRLVNRRKDGTLYLEDQTITPVLSPSGAIERFVTVKANVTEEVAAEEQRHRLLSIIEATPDIVSIADVDGSLMFMNRAGREILGMGDDSDLSDHDVSDYTPAWAIELLEEEAIPAATSEGSWTGEGAVLSADGREVPIWQVVLAHGGSDGEIEYLSTIARDLTDRKEVESALAERVKEIRTLYDVHRELARTDRTIDQRLEDVVALLPQGWLHPELTEARIVCRGRAFATDGFRETPWVLREEVLVDEEVIGSVEVVLTEEPPGRDEGKGWFLAEEHDLIESLARIVGEALARRRLQDEFTQAQKMETIGRLAGGVAHDFNNLLTVIQGATQMVLGDLPKGASVRSDMEEVLNASRRGADLTRQLLTFSRRDVLREETFCVRDALRELEPMIRRLTPERIEVEIETGDEPGLVKADRGKLGQAIMNLAVNSIDAMDGDGTITFRVAIERFSRQRAIREIPWDMTPGSYVALTVEDTGRGMHEEEVDRIFEPFFTTKPEGKGTGLGLSVVYGFIKQSGGHVFVDSEPGRGTSFRLLLPVERRADADGAEGARSDGSDHEEGRIGASVLLVEDDPAVRSVAARMIRKAGCSVVQASSGEEALEVARSRAGEIDIVLSDVVMPDLGGVRLIDRLRELYPDLKVVLMSGYSGDEVGPDGRDATAAFLDKPFSITELTQALKDTLGE